MTRTQIYGLVVPILNRKILTGTKIVNSGELFLELRRNDPMIFVNWHGKGKVAAADGIKKAIGDFLDSIHLEKRFGGYALPTAQFSEKCND